MDYREVIEYFERRMELKEKEVPSENQYIKQADDTLREIYKTTIFGMQELQSIHNNGISIERLKDIDFRKQVIEHINYMDYMAIKDELEEYKQLGTLEEVRDAVEKQKAKEPRATNRCYVCPRCGLVTSLKIKHNYCDACGQHIDWSEEDD